MTMDKLESVIENCTAALDVVPSKPIGDLEEELIPVKDFVSHSLSSSNCFSVLSIYDVPKITEPTKNDEDTQPIPDKDLGPPWKH